MCSQLSHRPNPVYTKLPILTTAAFDLGPSRTEETKERLGKIVKHLPGVKTPELGFP